MKSNTSAILQVAQGSVTPHSKMNLYEIRLEGGDTIEIVKVAAPNIREALNILSDTATATDSEQAPCRVDKLATNIPDTSIPDSALRWQ